MTVIIPLPLASFSDMGHAMSPSAILCRLLDNPITNQIGQAEHMERKDISVTVSFCWTIVFLSGKSKHFQMMKTTFLSASALDEHKLSCAFARAEALAQVWMEQGKILALECSIRTPSYKRIMIILGHSLLSVLPADFNWQTGHE